MITSIKVKTGFASELKSLKGKRFEFTKGVNVLYGPSGCGKTTLLRILGAYSCCWHRDYGGWSRRPQASWRNEKDRRFPAALRKLCVGECSADVGWDGTPVLYHEAGKSDDYSAFFYGQDLEDSPDGLNTGLEQLQIKHANISAGQLRLYKLKKLKDRWDQPPDLTVLGPRPTAYDKAFNEYITTLPRHGRTTLLLDEPDRSLSAKHQFDFWVGLMPQWAKEAQVIVASHSFFPALLDDLNFNVIDLVNGYRDEVASACVVAIPERMKSLWVQMEKEKQGKE